MTDSKPSITIDALAGVFSGGLTRFLIAPFDVLKIRFQNQVLIGSRYNGLFQAVTSIGKEEGIKGFWRGTIPGICLWGSYTMVQFPVYYQSKAFLSNNMQFGEETAKVVEPVICGGFAACIAQSISFPFDNIRTRIATFHVNTPSYKNSMSGQFLKILKTESFKGLFSGWLVTMLQVGPNNALVFLLYENIAFEALTSLPILSFASKGACAGLLAKIVTYPLDTVKKRLQLNGTISSVPKYDGISHCIKEIIKKEGASGFFKGLSPQLYKTGVSYALTFTIFETCREALGKTLKQD